MTENALKDQFTEALLAALTETFENVFGMYLDRGTSVFETLATISAEEASRPISPTCATVAAHVEHMAFYMDITVRFVRGERPQVDWTEIWRTVSAVTPEEWAASQKRLRNTYEEVRKLARSMETWGGENEMGGAMALLMHNAFHLGQIRHALCVIKGQG